MGWMGTINTAGIAGGPLAGGLAAEVDWRLAYYLIILMTVAAVALFLGGFAQRPAPERRRAGLLAELGAASRVRALRLVCLGGFSAFFAYGAALTFVGNALEVAPFGYSEATIGTAIASGGLAGILVSPGAGWVADRLGRGRSSVIGFSLAALAYLGFGLAGTLPAVLLLFFMLGAAMAFTWAGLMTLSVEVIPGARNISSTLFNATRFSGYALAPYLLVFIYTTSGLAYVLAVSAAMAVLGLAAAVAISRREGADAPARRPVSSGKAGP